MATRPFAFGLRLRDRDRTLRVRSAEPGSRRAVVEESRRGRTTRRREHGTLAQALADAAALWRDRLH